MGYKSYPVDPVNPVINEYCKIYLTSGAPNVRSSSSITFFHNSLQSQSRFLKTEVSCVTEKIRIASATSLSHFPQLWGPRIEPAPTGSDIMTVPGDFSLPFMRALTALHNHGGRESPRSNISATSVPFWTLH